MTTARCSYLRDPMLVRLAEVTFARFLRRGIGAAIAFAALMTSQEARAEVDVEHDAKVSPSLFAAAETMVFPQGSAGLFGARGGLQTRLIHEAALRIDAGVLAGNARDPLGAIHETIGTLGASLFAMSSGGAHGIAFGVGPRVEAGIGWFRGQAGDPRTSASSARSALLFVALSGMASFRIGGPWSGLVGIDAGTSVYGFDARADGRTVSELEGAMMTIRVGFLWNPSSR
jgi:hypothetical protein